MSNMNYGVADEARKEEVIAEIARQERARAERTCIAPEKETIFNRAVDMETNAVELERSI